jgi:signal transduction histidine kinase
MDSESEFQQRLLREKLASLKEFAYGASHELNNPLFNISSRAQLLLRDERDPERRRKLATIYAHALRASEMIKDMALAAQPPRPTLVETNVLEIVKEVVGELAPAARDEGIKIAVLSGDDEAIVVQGDAVQLGVAIREVTINACEALRRAGRGGRVELSVGIDEERVEIVIHDNGPGLDARARRHLFDPFFSGYESGRGLGFGLTKCWQIIDAHVGEIVVDSEAGSGTTFTLRLPRVASR